MAGLALALAASASLCVAATACAWPWDLLGSAGWDDATGNLDMPWLASGERARLFTKQSPCVLCPTGYKFSRSWGASARGGQDPYSTVEEALRFLGDRGVLETWPVAIAEGTVSDGREIITPRAAPYRFTIIALEPTVVVLRFDLGALIKVGDFDAEQSIGTPRLNQAVDFGTRIAATGTLLWFSPDAGQTPAPVKLAAPDRGEIVVEGRRIVLERNGDEWIVEAPVATK